MSDGLKLRNVLNDPRKNDVCLDDVVMAFASASEKLRQLEYKNSVHSYREARKAFNSARKVMTEFDVRFKGEIKEDIILAISKVDKRIDPQNVTNANQFFGED